MKFAIVSLWMVSAVSVWAEDSVPRFEGRWTAKSLSDPDQRILVVLELDGQAIERIGNFVGTGRWEVKGKSAWIEWASGWTGVLRKGEDGHWELLTWKKGSDRDGPPDDVQRAHRLDRE